MIFTENPQILISHESSVINIIKTSNIFLGSDTAIQIYQEFIQCIKEKVEFIIIDLTESKVISNGGIKVLKLCQSKADRLGVHLKINAGNSPVNLGRFKRRVSAVPS